MMSKIVRMYSDEEIVEKIHLVLDPYCRERGMHVEDVFDMEWMIAWVKNGLPELGNEEGNNKYAILLNPWVEELRAVFKKNDK